MTSRALRLALAALGVALAGCATSFTGDSKFPGGEAGCTAKCNEKGMTMGAFVYMGEYSTGCVCQPKVSAPPAPPAPPPPAPAPPPVSAAPPLPAKPPAPAPSSSALSGALLPTGAVVAVVMQMRQMQQQQQMMTQAHH